MVKIVHEKTPGKPNAPVIKNGGHKRMIIICSPVVCSLHDTYI